MNVASSHESGFPTHPYQFDDLRLGVGHRLQLAVAGRGEPIPVRLLGYQKGETLLVRLAHSQLAGINPLSEGDTLEVRGFSGRIAFTFGSTIEKIRYSPYAYCHLKFPDAIHGTEIRHAERVRVNLPVRVVGTREVEGGAVEAVIANISIEGALLVSPEALGQVGDQLALTFRFWILPQDYEVNMQAAAVIQTVAEAGASGISYGVRFEGLRSTETILLQNMIYQRMQESPDISV